MIFRLLNRKNYDIRDLKINTKNSKIILKWVGAVCSDLEGAVCSDQVGALSSGQMGAVTAEFPVKQFNIEIWANKKALR